MRMKIVLISLGVAVAAIALTYLGFRYFLGFRFELGRSKMQIHVKRSDETPLGVVWAVAPESSRKVIPDSVGIRAFNELYASIGVTREEFDRWESEHGMDSLGTDANGKVLAPGYPVLSKVAWMYIDPVTLTPAETEALIQECERAILSSANESAKHELEAIRALAGKALSNAAVIQFGHP